MSQMRVLIVIGLALALSPQTPATAPEFQNGLAQPVFAGQRIIRHNVWVEVPALDTDRDGVLDRIRVQISRPEATERGTKLPVILMASPYSGGTATGTSGKTPGRASSDGTMSAPTTVSMSKAPPITPRTIALNFIPVDADSSPTGLYRPAGLRP